MDEHTTPDFEPTPDMTRDDKSTTEPQLPPIDTPDDPVGEASDESFPASDPPSFTRSTAE